LLNKLYILTILWLGIISSQLVFAAANDCPKDSLIRYDENNQFKSKENYQYDDAGHTLEEATYTYQNGWIGTSRTTREYYESGKVKNITSWQWSSETNNWIGKEKYHYEYNTSGSMTLYEHFVWGTTDWENKDKTINEYDASNRLTLELTLKGNGTQWNNSTKHEYQYDAKGKKILDRYWRAYDSESGSWIGSTWSAWAYNSTLRPNDETLTETYEWVGDNWSGKNKVEFDYNAKGLTTLKRYYSNYDPISQKWEYYSEYKYQFDQWDNQTSTEVYFWSVDHWKGDSKTEYEFDATGKQLAKATYSWDDTNRKWIGINNSKTLYDENGNLILDEQYEWQGNDWVGLKKEEMIYDDAKNIISKKTYQWLTETATWINYSKDSASYDANRNTILDEKYLWNTTDNYWVGQGEKHVSEFTNNMETLQEVYIWSNEKRDWTYKSKIIKAYDGAKVILDEEYQLSGTELVGTKKEKYAYNTKGETVLTVKYSWLHDEVWQGADSTLANYNNNKQQTLDEQYTWATAGNYWKGKEKATYTFNSNKQQTSSWVYNWDDSNRQWIYASRDTSSYDSRKNLTLDERYTWDAEKSDWVGTLKKEYAYNAKGQQTMFAYYAWDEVDGKFIGTQKEENEVDDEGRTILHAEYTWGTTTWKGKSKDTYTYLSGDTQSSHISYSWKSNKWVENKKTEWTYTESGNVATETLSNWNSAWVYDTKTENTYTEDVLTAYIKSKWESSAWVYETKWEQIDQNTDRSYEWWNSAWSITQENKKTYDGENRLILESKQNWQQGVQTEGSKSVYQYTGNNLTLQSDSVYSTALTQWQETKRVTNAFDANDQQTLAMTQVFENGTQTSGDKTTNTYNGEGLQTNTTISTWAESDWQYVSKVDNVYVGKSVTTTSYIWDNTIPNWQGVEKDEKIYSNDLDYTSTKSEWRNGAWFGISKTGYTYYEDGREHSVTDYVWSSSTWVYDFKTEFEYSGAKNIVTATYLWEETKWVGQSKEGTFYDEYEDLTTATWTWKNNAWSPQSKSGQSLYDDGRTKSKTSYKIAGSDFVYTARVEYEYGATAKDITTANYTWDGAAWKGTSKSGEVWDGSKITSKISYTWIGGFDWQYNQKTEYEYGSHQSDLTTAVYSWDNTIPDWVGVSKSGKTYASTGKQASEFSYIWGTTAAGKSEWLPVAKTEWEYGTGKDNAIASYKGVDTAWVGVSKTAETYTGNGNIQSKYTYCWKNSTWADSLKQEYTYNEYGDNTLYIDASWNGTSWVWTSKSKKWDVNYYNHDTKQVYLDAHYIWDEDDGWIGSGNKLEYEYNASGDTTLEVKSKWSNGDWIGSSKVEKEYYHGYIILNRSWYYDLGRWKGKFYYEYEYKEVAGHDTLTMAASYSWGSSNWTGTYKTEYVFDEYGNQSATINYKWKNNKWVYKDKEETKYNENGQILYKLKQTYSTSWVNSTKSEYGYDEKGTRTTYVYSTWKTDHWVVREEEKQTYDNDEQYKLRTDLAATYNASGAVLTYYNDAYYYVCDPKFQVEVKASPEDGGSVSGGGEFILNGQAVITAVPDSGCYTFKHWIDQDSSVVSTAPRYTFLVNKTNTYTASFTPILRTIRASVAASGGGSVSVAIKKE